MLSGAKLQNQLSKSVHVFADTENIGELSTLDALNKLIELYPIFPDTLVNTNGERVPDPLPESYANNVKGKTDLLRRRLRNILAAETSENKLLCDKAFELQMILARGFPINPDTDIITLVDFDKNTQLVFLSDGTVFSLESAKDYFSRGISFRDDHFQDLNREPLSNRELISLTAQGITTLGIRIPNSIPEWGKYVGNIIGTFITLTLFGVIATATGLFPPLLLGPMFAISTMTLFASRHLEPSAGLRMYGPIAGITMIAALVSFVFPPAMALIAASSLISTSTAAAAVTFMTTIALPYIMPGLMIGVAAIRRIKFPEISFVDALFKIANFPHVVIKTICASIGELIGKGIQRIVHYFKPPIVNNELLIPANNVVAVNSSSHSLINETLGIDATAAPSQQSMPIVKIAAPTEQEHPQSKMECDELALTCNDAFNMIRHA